MDSCADSQEIFDSLKVQPLCVCIQHFVSLLSHFIYLQKAFDEMLKILRCLNQSMDVVGLKGFPVRKIYTYV